MRVAPAIILSMQERKKLEAMKRGRASSVRAKERSAIILLAADGLQNKEIAESLGRRCHEGRAVEAPVCSEWTCGHSQR